MRGAPCHFKQRYRLRVRLYAQFRSGKAGEAPELARSSRLVAGPNEKLHETALRLLVERIGLCGPARILHREILPPPTGKPLGQGLERRHETPLQILSFKLAPLDIPILQQVPFVAPEGMDRSGEVLQPGFGLTGSQHTLSELLDIYVAQIHVEPHRRGRCHEHICWKTMRSQHALETPCYRAEIGSGPFLW